MPYTKNKSFLTQTPPNLPLSGEEKGGLPLIRGIKGVCTKSRHGFTLVELIVTITIIAILGTIAFTAFNGFQSSARDSTRASDLANLSQALDTYYIKTGSYPNPDNSFTVTYSGGSLWYQGTVGDTLINILSSNGSKLSKKPTDPLTTTREYTYSKSAYGNTYELSSNWEGDRIALNTLIPQVYAASSNPLITYIKGNYNGMVAKTVTGSTVYVIATPSLTTSTGTAGSSIDVTTLSGKLLYHGQTNSGGISYTPTLIYSSGSLPTNDTTGQITLLTTNLQTAYSGSVISSNANISNVLTTTGATNITSLGVSIITNYLGGSASAPPPPPATSYNISNSLMFDSAGSQYLSKSFTTAGNTKKWTWSGWVKRGKIGSMSTIISAQSTVGYIYTELRFNSDDKIRFHQENYATTLIGANTVAVFRDPSAWYHITATYDSVQSPGYKLYVNGVQQALTFDVNVPINNPTDINIISVAHQIGGNTGGPIYLDGYLADVNFVDSGALDPTSFGYTDPTTNQWLPKAYTGTYGTNGFHLDFSDTGALTTTSNVGLGKDSSGNGNYWTTNNLALTNSFIDTPLNNFATLNPLDRHTDWGTLTNGNLTAAISTLTTDTAIRASIPVPNEKYYFEYTIDVVAGGSAHSPGVGFLALSHPIHTSAAELTPAAAIMWRNANKSQGAGFVSWGRSLSAGNTGRIAINRTTGDAWVGDSTGWFGDGDPMTGVNPTFIGLTGEIAPAAFNNNIASSQRVTFNFGATNFKYTPPSGFKPLSTANLPDPTIKNPKLFFDVLTYDGSDSSQSLSGLSFRPDFVWMKSRTTGYHHFLADSVRGGAKILSSSQTAAESAWADNVFFTSFDTNGFILPGNVATNDAGQTQVAWNWKKGSGLAGPGFDIVSYTGNGGLNTIAHNLGKKPDFIVIKNRDNGTLNWGVYHSALGATKYMRLNTPDPFSTDLITTWNNTEPTSTGFTVNTWTAINESTKKHIAYLWSEVPGFSKFGSYTGNGTSDGPFVYTGFRPRYVMIKRTDVADSWTVLDTARELYNPVWMRLDPDNANSENNGVAHALDMDILSNGFKIKSNNPQTNAASPATYIYAAFAEAPFKYANAR